MTLLDPHLDLDQVSAAVDGEREPAVAAHLLVCLACRQQVDTWRAALGSLRDLPTAPDADIDVAVARAMATWAPVARPPSSVPSPVPGSPADGSDRRGSSPEPSIGPARNGPAGNGAAGVGAAGNGAAGNGAARWLLRLRPPPGVAAALMVVVLLAGAGFGVSRLSNGQNGDKSSGSATAALPAPGRAASAAPAQPPPVFGRTAQLAAQLRRVTRPAGAAAPVTGGAGGGSASGSSPGATAVVRSAPCLSQVERIAGARKISGGDAPYFDETVRLAGVRSQVFAFTGANGPVALVVRSHTCSLLATVQF